MLYRNLFFTQDSELFGELEQIMAEHGTRKMLDYLEDAGALDEPIDERTEPPWGTSDELTEGPLYAGGNTLVTSYNPRLGYLGVTEVIHA